MKPEIVVIEYGNGKSVINIKGRNSMMFLALDEFAALVEMIEAGEYPDALPVCESCE